MHFRSVVGRVSISILLAILGALTVPTLAVAAPRDIYVEAGGTGDGTLASPYGSIATALTDAVMGDTIHVGEGTFVGCYTLKKGVSLIGQGASKTTLQGDGTSCVLFGDDLSSTTVISGFTITGGAGRAGTLDRANNVTVSQKVGGAIVLLGGTGPVIEDNVIRDNDAYNYGSGLGGAVYLSVSQAQIRNNTISNNRGGYGGAIYLNTGSSAVIEGNVLSENTAAGYGGAVAFGEHASATVSGNTITGNSAGYNGGAITVGYGSGPAIVNNIIAGNNGVYGGGGIYCLNGAPPTIVNNTVTGNTAQYGAAGIEAEYSTTSVVIKNCIVWGNAKTGTTTPTSIRNVSPTYSCIEGGSGGTGNMNSEPLFADASAGDYALQVTSPAVNAGTATGAPATDFEGAARPQGAGFDMGALERSASEMTVPALDGSVSVTFPEVWRGSTVTAVKQPLGEGQNPPVGYALAGDAYYDISPAGTWDRGTQPARVTLRFDDSGLSDAERASIRIFHYSDGGVWEDITSVDGLDLDAKTVSGTTTSFSDFGVFYEENAAPGGSIVSVDASSWWTLALMVGAGAGGVAVNRRRRLIE